MARVMIKCPNTGEPIDTGLDMSPVAFGTSRVAGSTIEECPHCGEQHTWDKEEAYLEGVQHPSTNAG